MDDTQKARLMAEIGAWQEFAESSPWREMTANLRDEEARFIGVLRGTHASLTAEIACAQGQLQAIESLLAYPTERIDALRKALESA